MRASDMVASNAAEQGQPKNETKITRIPYLQRNPHMKNRALDFPLSNARTRLLAPTPHKKESIFGGRNHAYFFITI
jgi:hypothetical protein